MSVLLAGVFRDRAGFETEPFYIGAGSGRLGTDAAK